MLKYSVIHLCLFVCVIFFFFFWWTIHNSSSSQYGFRMCMWFEANFLIQETWEQPWISYSNMLSTASIISCFLCSVTNAGLFTVVWIRMRDREELERQYIFLNPKLKKMLFKRQPPWQAFPKIQNAFPINARTQFHLLYFLEILLLGRVHGLNDAKWCNDVFGGRRSATGIGTGNEKSNGQKLETHDGCWWEIKIRKIWVLW